MDIRVCNASAHQKKIKGAARQCIVDGEPFSENMPL